MAEDLSRREFLEAGGPRWSRSAVSASSCSGCCGAAGGAAGRRVGDLRQRRAVPGLRGLRGVRAPRRALREAAGAVGAGRLVTRGEFLAAGLKAAAGLGVAGLAGLVSTQVRARPARSGRSTPTRACSAGRARSPACSRRRP